MSPLEQLLAEQKSGGRYVDSAAFSLDVLRAREKLARYELAPGLWLVSLVQAAVALQATSIDIAFGARAVRISFDSAVALEADDILHRVLADVFPDEDGMFHLIAGIRSSAGETTQQVTWSAGATTVCLTGNATQVTANQEGPGFRLSATRPYRARSLAKTMATSLSHLVRQVADEYEQVASRCFVSPVPIRLDGRPLQTGYGSPNICGFLETPGAVLMQYEKSRQNIVTACLGLRLLPPLADRPGLPKLPAPEGVSKPVYKNGTFLTWPDETASSSAGAVICLLSHHSCISQVHYVLDGAIVASETVPWDPGDSRVFGIKVGRHNCGVHVLVGVRRRELDLSHFEVRERAQLTAAVLGEVKGRVVDVIERVLRELNSLYYLPCGPVLTRVAGVGFGLQAAGACMALGPWGAVPTAAVVGAGLGMNVMVYRSQVKHGLQALLASIRASARG